MLKLTVKTNRAYGDGKGERDKTARHHWWPVAYSRDLHQQPDKPLAVTLFGEPLVLFQAADGSLQCVADVCPHKSAALSQGYVENGELVCRYHGWRFGKDGQCRYPNELAGKGRTTLYSYPVVDDGLLLWVFPSLEEPVEFINPIVEYAGRAGRTFSVYQPREFEFDQPWEIWAASFVDNTHHEYAHPNTFLKAQRDSLNFIFDEQVSPAAMLVYGNHDQSLGVMAYLVFSPVEENKHKQFLTLFPTSDILPAAVSYGLFRALRIPNLLYSVVYEDYYLIVKQVQRIQQGASKWGFRGKYGAPVSDRFIDWHRTKEQDAVWFESYAANGLPVLRPELPSSAQNLQKIPVLQDSGPELGPQAARQGGANFEAAAPSTWAGLNFYDRAIKAIVERAVALSANHG